MQEERMISLGDIIAEACQEQAEQDTDDGQRTYTQTKSYFEYLRRQDDGETNILPPKPRKYIRKSLKSELQKAVLQRGDRIENVVCRRQKSKHSKEWDAPCSFTELPDRRLHDSRVKAGNKDWENLWKVYVFGPGFIYFIEWREWDYTNEFVASIPRHPESLDK